MKIKPLYIYLIGFTLFIAVLVGYQLIQKGSKADNDAVTGQAPNDAVHGGMGGGQKMGAMSEAFKKKEADMKAEVEKNPNDTLVMRKYAEFLMYAHKPMESVKYLEQIVKTDPKRIDILFSITYIYHLQKNYEKAEEATNKILAIDKNNSDAIYNLGFIINDKGNKEKAKEIWNDVIKRFPNSEAAKLSKEALDPVKK